MKPRKLFVFIILLLLALGNVKAQTITGLILDAETGDTIPYASCIYKGHGVAVASNLQGQFTIARHNGWPLTFSALGYQSKAIAIDSRTPHYLRVLLQPDTKVLGEVTIKAKRQRYSRKNNPAVELMKKVVAAKKRSSLDNRDYYQYNKYQKLTLALNDISPAILDSGKMTKKKQWMLNQIEVCNYNNKLILPISVDETVSQKIYRRDPHDEKIIVKGINNQGINDLIQTGDILTAMLKDLFTDINIYDDQIRLLQHPFTSPIGKDAIAFYRFYIEDTVYVNRDLCFHLSFLPNNQQDFGFRGQLYILADSSFQVKRCDMTIPNRSDVNFVENMKITQEFTQLPDGEWVLTVDDMFTELKALSFLQEFAVIRTTRLTDYAFDPLPKQLFKGKKKEVKEVNAMIQGEDFWNRYRQVELTRSESQMGSFVHGMEQMKGFKYILIGLKALIENFVETGSKNTPSKVDIGPINTIVTHNFVDGFRFRMSAQTTANLDSNLFVNGYIAHGLDSKKTYYKGEVTWSFNKKEYMPREFPTRSLSFMSTYDVMSPSDKFVSTDKDNVFTAFKWAKVDKMMFYNRQALTFVREEDWGFRTTVGMKTEENEGAAQLFFVPLSAGPIGSTGPISPISNKFRTTELRAELRIAPGETYINTKQRRVPINLDAPVFTVSHAMGLKDFLGGDYAYNYTEVSFFKRVWLKSWGKLDVNLKGGIQWNQVPFPLLIMPETNLSYIKQERTFSTINNMEFLNDRFAYAMLSWDLNGKIFNRIPLLHYLKWREYLSVKCMWGDLTSKNNPLLAKNAGSDRLMYFPEGSYIMDSKRPYWEVSAGVRNIFKVFHVEYVRRLNYLDLPTANKHGIRVVFHPTF